MTVIEDRLAFVLQHRLQAGSHKYNASGEMCFMEAVAYVSGERWSDHPKCASPTIGSFMRTLNDRLNDDDRQLLSPYIERLVGSVGTAEQEDERVWMCADWLVHQELPLWLRLAQMEERAAALEACPEIRSREEWITCRRLVIESRDDAWKRSSGWRANLRKAVYDKVREALKADAAVADVADVAAAAAVDAAVAAGDVFSYGSPGYWQIRRAVERELRQRIPKAETSLERGLDLLKGLLAVTGH